MVLSDYRRKEFQDTDKITGSYIVFYQGISIDHFTHVPGTVAQYSDESDYNGACNSGMVLAQLIMLNN